MTAARDPAPPPAPPAPEPAARKHYCPCGRYLGEGTADRGYLMVKCQGCGVWRKLVFTVTESVVHSGK